MEKIDKASAVEILEEISLIKALKGENFFKVRAFDNAARALKADTRDLTQLMVTGELEHIKGIGQGYIASILRELFEKGKSSDYAKMRKTFLESLFEIF